MVVTRRCWRQWKWQGGGDESGDNNGDVNSEEVEGAMTMGRWRLQRQGAGGGGDVEEVVVAAATWRWWRQ